MVRETSYWLQCIERWATGFLYARIQLLLNTRWRYESCLASRRETLDLASCCSLGITSFTGAFSSHLRQQYGQALTKTAWLDGQIDRPAHAGLALMTLLANGGLRLLPRALVASNKSLRSLPERGARLNRGRFLNDESASHSLCIAPDNGFDDQLEYVPD